MAPQQGLGIVPSINLRPCRDVGKTKRPFGISDFLFALDSCRFREVEAVKRNAHVTRT